MAGFFTKLDSGITDSTIWHQPDPTRIMWITMMAMADQHGYVGASIPGLASRARVALADCITALECFKAPDEYSRTKDYEGRRIADAAGGWVLLNHAKYRAAQSADDRRERSRVAMAELRAKRRATSLTSVNGEQSLTMLAQAEADNRDRTEAIPGGAPPGPPQPPSTGSASGKPAQKRASKPAGPTSEVWTAYAQAYMERYGIEPVRNAKVNGQFSQLVKRLGADEAPGVARSYLANRNALYVASKHCTDLMLRDCEKLRTEWITGAVTHQRDAREADRLGSNGSMWAEVSAELNARGIK